MTRAFISIGSNMDPEMNVIESILALEQLERITGISAVYSSPAIGRPNQPEYYNCVVQIDTSTSPDKLKSSVLRRIELELGRVRSADKYAPRPIDLDLIWYDHVAQSDPELTLPDPQIKERPMLAALLCELAPELPIPDSGTKLRDLASAIPSKEMKRLDEYTRILWHNWLAVRQFDAIDRPMKLVDIACLNSLK